MQRLSSILLIMGSILFLIAAFAPISMRVFPEADPQKRVNYVNQDKTGWLIAHLLFSAGALLTVIGLGLFAVHVQTVSQDGLIRPVMILSAGVALLGVVLWLIVVYNRITLPAEEVFGNASINPWMFPAYTILTQIALMIFGFVLVQTGYPTWLGWGLLGLAALSLVAFLIFKDMPPFIHYVLLLIVGIVLAR